MNLLAIIGCIDFHLTLGNGKNLLHQFKTIDSLVLC
jgi:hypothetical protein